MNSNLLIENGNAAAWCILGVVVVFDLILRGIAMWKAAKRNQHVWFILLLFISSVGILPVIYLLLVDKKLLQKEANDKEEE